MAAVYTAFLFGQAEGRDLWQSPLLPLHLLIQAILAGAATLLLYGFAVELSPELQTIARTALLGALTIDLVAALPGELFMPHASEVASRAAKAITKGHHARRFWVDVVCIGHVVPIAILGLGFIEFDALAALAALVGLTSTKPSSCSRPRRSRTPDGPAWHPSTISGVCDGHSRARRRASSKTAPPTDQRLVGHVHPAAQSAAASAPLRAFKCLDDRRL